MIGQHTPEPWQVDRLPANEVSGIDPDKRDWQIYIETPRPDRLTVARVQGATKEESEANGARIVACVNACAGIETEKVQSGVVSTAYHHEIVHKHVAKRLEAEHQRDELIAALQDIANNPSFPDHHIRAAAAIARVQP